MIYGQSLLSERVVRMCDDVIARLGSSDTRTAVEAIRGRLNEPLRLAVAGRVGAGKSTIVNALLGMRVAPTSAGETTQVVTWFRYGETDRAVLHMRDGTSRPLALGGDRTLPADLGVDVDAVDAIDVSLYSAALERMTIIDTPGLASMTAGASERTEVLLGLRSRNAVSQADGLLYVMTRDVREDDAAVLAGFREHAAQLDASAGNAIALLNKADKLAPVPAESEAAARKLADRWSTELGGLVAAVIPLMGLLAETAEAGRIDEGRVRRMSELAALPAERRAVVLSSARRLLADPDLAIEPEDRADLLDRLDLLGLRCCADALDDGRSGAVEITDMLRRRSGIGALRQAIDMTFGPRVGVLKANAALTALDALAVRSRDEAGVLSAVVREAREWLEVSPDARSLREHRLLQDVSAGRLELPDGLRADLQRFTAGSSAPEKLGLDATASPSDVCSVALERTRMWRAFGNDARCTPEQASAARVLAVSYAALLREAQQAEAAA